MNIQKFTEKKIRNQGLKDKTKNHLSEKGYMSYCACGVWLDFISDYAMQKKKLRAANFCKWRFCPLCAKRKSIKDAFKLNVMMLYLMIEHKMHFLFITLTAPRVRGHQLKGAIVKRNGAVLKMFKRREVVRFNKGYIRKVEITYDGEKYITPEMYKQKNKHYKNRGLKIGDLNPSYDTYHFHNHIILAVSDDYFKNHYTSRARWLELWQESMKDYSITQVDVRKVTTRKTKVDDSSDTADKSMIIDFDVAEFAKYQAKDSDYGHSQGVFDTFVDALKGTKNLTFNGLFAEAAKKFDDGELDKYISKDTTKYYWNLMYSWNGNAYREPKREELDKLDRLFLKKNGFQLDESFDDDEDCEDDETLMYFGEMSEKDWNEFDSPVCNR